MYMYMYTGFPHGGDKEMQETWIPALSGKDSLEEGMATIPVFLPERSHGQKSLVGYSPRGHKELDTQKHLSTVYMYIHIYAIIISEYT